MPQPMNSAPAAVSGTAVGALVFSRSVSSRAACVAPAALSASLRGLAVPCDVVAVSGVAPQPETALFLVRHRPWRLLRAECAHSRGLFRCLRRRGASGRSWTRNSLVLFFGNLHPAPSCRRSTTLHQVYTNLTHNLKQTTYFSSSAVYSKSSEPGSRGVPVFPARVAFPARRL
jgi:hypothetical protein